MKTCVQCEKLLGVEKFQKNNKNADGLTTKCKSCTKAFYEKCKLEKICFNCFQKHTSTYTRCNECRERKRLNKQKLYDFRLVAKICTYCGKFSAEESKTRCLGCLTKINLSNRKSTKSKISRKKWKVQLKDEVFAAYGGYICKCCGETEKTFLTIDHMDGGGTKHRKEVGQGDVYNWLKQNNYPVGFQVLCQNCNVGKYRNNGICPHKSTEIKIFTLQEYSKLND